MFGLECPAPHVQLVMPQLVCHMLVLGERVQPQREEVGLVLPANNHQVSRQQRADRRDDHETFGFDEVRVARRPWERGIAGYR